MRFHIFYTAILAAVVSLVGCGGSSGSTNNANPTPTPIPGVQTYGFFRKLNPTAKSVNSTNGAMAYSDNSVITMSSPRAGHRAVQISEDIFMLIGGEFPVGKNITDKAPELPSTIDYFDRVTETFTHKNVVTNVSRHCYSDGSLSFGALRLPDGNILMVGGADTVKDTVEIYNPTTESIVLYKDVFPNETPVNNITDMFYMGNDKVLLVGCAYTEMPAWPQTILRGNGILDLLTMKASLIYTPVNVYYGCAVQVADGSVIIMGGIEQDSKIVHKDIWKVDSSNFVTTKVADMSTERYAFGAVLLGDGKVGMYGGVNYSIHPPVPNYPKSVDIYDPTDNSMSRSADLPAPRNSLHPVLLQNGFTLNAGGCEEGHLVNTEIVHNHITNVVGSTGNLTTGRRFFSVIPLNNGRLLISGGDGDGYNNQSLNTAEIYDPNTKIIISYNNSIVKVNGNLQFTTDKSCTWSVVNVDPKNKNVGSISTTGLFTAPGIATRVKVVATSDDGSESASVIITVINANS